MITLKAKREFRAFTYIIYYGIRCTGMSGARKKELDDMKSSSKAMCNQQLWHSILNLTISIGEAAKLFSVFSADVDRVYYCILATCSAARTYPMPNSIDQQYSILFLFIIIVNSVAGTGSEAPPQRVLVNGTAQMKCDIATSMTTDKALLVVWYKNNLPIYR